MPIVGWCLITARHTALAAMVSIDATKTFPARTYGGENLAERHCGGARQYSDEASGNGLWHKDLLGWPSANAAPVHKDHATDWISEQTSKGLAFNNVEFKPATIQAKGDVAVTCYWIRYKWLDKDGNGTTRTLRITHTLLREGKDWRIIGGMSMLEGVNAQKSFKRNRGLGERCGCGRSGSPTTLRDETSCGTTEDLQGMGEEIRQGFRACQSQSNVEKRGHNANKNAVQYEA